MVKAHRHCGLVVASIIDDLAFLLNKLITAAGPGSIKTAKLIAN
jgi:hypothetical protein